MDVTLSAELGQIWFPRFIDIPVQGPGEANRLLILTGIAMLDSAVPGDLHTLSQPGGGGPLLQLTLHLLTGYALHDTVHHREYRNVLNGNSGLLSATYITLSQLNQDPEPFGIFIDAVSASINSSNEVQIDSILRWGASDADLYGTDGMRVAYQANLLLKTVR